MDFTLIARAGLRQQDFAALCNVSRTTVNLWVTGKMSPHRFIKDKVQEMLDKIAKLVASGELPFENESQRSERLKNLVDAEQDAA